MSEPIPTPFELVPPSAGGHFVLNLYAGIFRLLDHIRRLSEVGGATLEATCERYPFLGHYFAEMRRHLPDELTWDDAFGWWQRQIESWERGVGEHLPLVALGRDSGVSFDGRLAFMVVGLVEEDSRFGTLFAELQEPLAHRRPTLELVGQVVAGPRRPDAVGEIDAWSLVRPLLAAGLLEAPNRDAPRSEWLLRVPPLLWDAARGAVEAQPAPWCRHRPAAGFPPIAELIYPPAILARLTKLPALLAAGKARTVVLRCDPGADPLEALGAVARELGRGLLAVEAGGESPGEAARLAGPLATLSCSLPALAYDLAPGETAEPPALAGYAGPVALCLGLEGGLGASAAERAVSLTLPAPRAELRRRWWRRAMGERPFADLEPVVERFHLAGRYIGQVAEIAVAQAGLDGREEVRLADVQEATRALNRQLLDTLAARLAARGSWAELVARETTAAKLAELERRCRHRERLLGHLGPAFGGNANRGVRALFTGASGTGKTLAAKILAAQLGMDLYRVDLAAVVNKYIGETEKNLHRVLSRAESLDVVLLLDEGDALLGQRTEVKSANDRYANLETNYLLQRLEGYQGIVVVTTNLGDNIDQAFQRRMDVVVPFFPPQAAERHRILQLHLPAGHQVAPQLLERVAVACTLNGGQIRNAAQHAALFALDEGRPIDDAHLLEGLRSEYRKAGGTFPLAPGAATAPRDGGMGAFVAALGAR